jgi:hypothetical protein
MSRRSRRKTLSSIEIDGFLSEIGSNKRRTTQKIVIPTLNDDDHENENIPPCNKNHRRFSAYPNAVVLKSQSESTLKSFEDINESDSLVVSDCKNRPLDDRIDDFRSLCDNEIVSDSASHDFDQNCDTISVEMDNDNLDSMNDISLIRLFYHVSE